MTSSTLVLQPGRVGYPSGLEDLPSARTLYLRGILPAGLSVAVVGTRAPSPEALDFTREVVAALAAAGVSIWSGGAHGIDAAAHRAALDAGTPTVVVCGGGLEQPYPDDHVELYADILRRGGACLARLPDEVQPRRGGFIARNALLAALTTATLVVEAPLKSGARSTAAAARRLKKPLLVVPHAPWDPLGAGCALELARGARAVATPDDVLEAIGLPRARGGTRAVTPARARPLSCPETPLPGPLSPDEAKVSEALGEEAVHVDLICERAGLATDRAVAALLTLTIKAVVVEGPAGSYRRASSSLSFAQDSALARGARSLALRSRDP